MGRVENKEDKLARIRAAARKLFLGRGFDETSVAEVAAEAGVAKGTVFLYAPTKADLVALVFEDALRSVSREAVAALRLEMPLHAELARMFSRFFDVYEPDPALARLVIRELSFASGHAARIRAEVDRELLTGVAAHVEARKERGEIARDVAPMAVATNAFAIYFLTLLGWLSGVAPSRALAEQYLAGSLELALRGVHLASGRPAAIAVPAAIAAAPPIASPANDHRPATKHRPDTTSARPRRRRGTKP